MNTSQLYSLYLEYPIICTDTRTIKPNCLFFALKGENFNANAYADQALDLGAAYVIIDEPQYRKDERYIVVENSLRALQDLACFHRQKLTIPVIGLTGSNGKTTSKELIRAVLAQRYKTFATIGNLNNHIGVPLTILSIQSDVEIAVIEMGANHQQEIEFLCTISQPNHGLVTNVGKAHLEGFGGLEGVMAGKGELYAYLSKNKGIIFINRDNSLLLKMSQNHNLEKTVSYGTGANNYVIGEVINSKPFLEVKWQNSLSSKSMISVAQSKLTGLYNFENILAAICIGSFFKLSVDEINAGIESYNPTNNRSQIIKSKSNAIICDYYNANPTSMFFALENLADMEATNKVMILGDMFELGEEAEKEHQNIVQKAKQIAADQRIFIGEEFYKCKDNTEQFYPNIKMALAYLDKNPIKNATILLKGSRSMKLEKLLPSL